MIGLIFLLLAKKEPTNVVPNIRLSLFFKQLLFMKSTATIVYPEERPFGSQSVWRWVVENWSLIGWLDSVLIFKPIQRIAKEEHCYIAE